MDSRRPDVRARGLRLLALGAGAALVVAVWVSSVERGARGDALGPGEIDRTTRETETDGSLWSPPDEAGEDSPGAHDAGAAPGRVGHPVDEPPPEPLPCFVRVASASGAMLAGAVVRSSFGTPG